MGGGGVWRHGDVTMVHPGQLRKVEARGVLRPLGLCGFKGCTETRVRNYPHNTYEKHSANTSQPQSTGNHS